MSEEAIYAAITKTEPIKQCDIDPRKILHGILIFILRNIHGIQSFTFYEMPDEFLIRIGTFIIPVTIDEYIDDVSSFFVDLETPREPSEYKWNTIAEYMHKKITEFKKINEKDYDYYDTIPDSVLQSSMKIIGEITNDIRALTDDEKFTLHEMLMNHNDNTSDNNWERINNSKSATFLLADNVSEIYSVESIHLAHISAITEIKKIANNIIGNNVEIINKLITKILSDKAKIETLQRRLIESTMKFRDK